MNPDQPFPPDIPKDLKIEETPILTPHPIQPEQPNQPVHHQLIISQGHGGNSFKRLLFLIFFLILFTSTTASGVMFAIAYLNVPGISPQIKHRIENMVMSLPFTPKTPKFLFTKAIEAHKNTRQTAFDFSLALDNKNVAQSLGLASLDGVIKGAVDYKNLKLWLNASVTKEFNADVRIINDKAYIKINKIPYLILTPLFGIKQSPKMDEALSHWISFDGETTFENTTSKALDSKEFESTYQKFIGFLDDRIMKAISISNTTEDKIPVHVLTFAPDDQTLDYIGEKIIKQTLDEEKKRIEKQKADLKAKGEDTNFLDTYQPSRREPFKISDTVKKLTYRIAFDQKTFHIRKVTLVFSINPSQSTMYPLPIPGIVPSDNQEIGLSFALKLSDFGKEVKVDPPDDVITSEEFFQKLMKAPGIENNFGPINPIDINYDNKRKEDINNIRIALKACQQKTTNNLFVVKLYDLVSCGTLTALPLDPETHENYIYYPNVARTGYTLRIQLSTGEFFTTNELGVVEKEKEKSEIPVLQQQQMAARDARRQSDLVQIRTALDAWAAENSSPSNSYPDTIDQLVPDYLAKILLNPQGTWTNLVSNGSSIKEIPYSYTVKKDKYVLCATLENLVDGKTMMSYVTSDGVINKTQDTVCSSVLK